MNKWNTIRTMLVISILLIGLAFVTINMSFAMPKENVLKKWDIGYGEVTYKYKDVTSISINREQIDFTVLFSKENPTYTFTFPVENKGDYDAYLESVQKTDLENHFLTIEENDYKWSEYVEYQVSYVKNNELNDIKRDEEVRRGDLLKNHSVNEIMVTVFIKEAKRENFFTQYPEGIEFSLSLRTNYQEKE